jgi:hypothetical protein
VTVQDIGSIGELIGAIATVATLLYLAVQLRANTVATQAESMDSNKFHASAVNLAIASDKAIVTIFRKGLADFESLDPDEQLQFTFFLAEYISIGDSSYTHMRSGRDDGTSFARWMNGTKHLWTTPGGRTYWRSFGAAACSDTFRSYVESEIFGSEHTA